MKSIIVLTLFCAILNIYSQSSDSTAKLKTIHSNDGESYKGYVIKEDSNFVLIRTPDNQFMTIEKIKPKQRVLKNPKGNFELTEEQKLIFYEENKKSSAYVVLNLILGYGIGSWVQGDITGGLIGTIGQFGGICTMLIYSAQSQSDNSNSKSMIFTSGDKTILIIGGIMLIGSYIADLVLPFTYAKSYNDKLRKKLGLHDISTVNIAPKLDYTFNNHVIPGIQLSINF